MADEEEAGKKAVQAWRVCINKITEFRDSLAGSEKFENLTSADRRANLNKVHLLIISFIEKDIEVNTIVAMADTADEHDEAMALCESLEKKIHNRIAVTL